LASIKGIIGKNFTGFAYFYRHLGYRLFVLLILSLSIGILDGFGLSMFLPLLQMVGETSSSSSNSLGNLNFLVTALESIGISFTLVSVLIIMVLFFSLKGVAGFFSYSYRTVIQQFFIRTLREKLIGSFNQVNYKYFVKTDAGRAQNAMSGEVERVSRAFQSYTATIENVVLVLVYLSFAFLVDARFALLVAAGGWATNFLYKIIYKKTKTASRKFSKDANLYQGLIIQYVSNFKYLKATALLGDYARQMIRSIRQIEESRRKIGILNAILQAIREPLMILIVSVVILIQTIILQAPLAPILISLLFFYRALTALVSMQNNWNQYLAVSGSMENLVDFQKELVSNREEIGEIDFNALKDNLKLVNASFSYGSEKTLKNLTLQINRGETIAFVGESGGGKTTLVNLLAGLIPVDEGIFLIDGQDRMATNITNFQKRLGYVTQEPVIFNDTIFNNITFWGERNIHNLNRFNEALEQASIDRFINELPDGADTMLGNNGINLSGGQRQRISIARELYKDIDILILDEATAALDSEAEKIIQTSIEKLKGRYTILVVAHRLATIRNADRIVLMQQGRIEEVGNFDNLMKRNNSFKRMVELQEL
jgi:subfamily B ATP-binding cassette protein MsbA